MDLMIDLTSPEKKTILDNVRVRVFSTENTKEAARVLSMIDFMKCRFVSVNIVWGEELNSEPIKPS